jgi:hypothetical protein
VEIETHDTRRGATLRDPGARNQCARECAAKAEAGMQIVAPGELALDGDGLLGESDGERLEPAPSAAREKKREGSKGSDVTHLRVPLVMIQRHCADNAGEGHGIELLTAAYASVHMAQVATKANVIATRATMIVSPLLFPDGMTANLGAREELPSYAVRRLAERWGRGEAQYFNGIPK